MQNEDRFHYWLPGLFENDNGNAFIENILPKDGVVEVHPGFFTKEESDRLLSHLINETQWQQDSMKFYGKTVNLPRLTAWYGASMKEYSYSGIDMQPRQWTEELLFIKERVEKHAAISFTSVLLNYYRNGNDSVSWHRDQEKVLRVNPVIASVSFGATRTFKFRHVDDHKLIRSVELTHGMYLLMKGETQHKWEHTIPKTKQPVGPRVSLTFRVLY
jgi:alkylated DNA repair dioxygenase AlkB